MVDLYLYFATFVLIVAGVAGVILIFQKFEWTVSLMIVAPFFPAFFSGNHIAGNADDNSLGSYIRIGFLALIGIGGVIKYIKVWSKHKGSLPNHILALFLFLLISILSTFYSIDTEYTLIRSITFIAFAGFLLGLNYWFDELDKFKILIDYLFYPLVILTIFNFISLLFPDRAWWVVDRARFLGFFDQPNSMGAFCVVSIPVFMYKYSISKTFLKQITILSIIMVVIMLLLTGSRTSLSTTLVGIFVWLFVQKRFTKIVMFLGLASIFFFIVIALNPSRFEREENDNGLTALTGRDQFWIGAATKISESPLIGYGYGVEGKIWQDSRFYDPDFRLWSGTAQSSLHNGYISILVGLGVFAFVFWLTFTILPFIKSRDIPNDGKKSFIYCIFIIGILTNLTENTIASASSIISLLYWTVWVIAGKIYLLSGDEN